ncbi:Signal transduction histidine kinase [Dyadobacter sp. SG02]|uniref:ligand-binding sensor domain-containing protein n=1 Tax=Dyadobacter sp. SG02 TaxID=1855291 RepID=UPI0008BC2902|nr:HAMP domain-containing sensor histidine kinase [Dyadobacter sp. SG02]SEI91074.1 Signal transduction histidine kinase [Dyadobacter sp. SG02]
MSRALSLVFSITCLLTALAARAQEINFKSDRYALRHYTAETGLPQNSVKTIVRDDAGFFWFGTEDGLARFDGRNFYVFNSSNAKFSSNRVIQSFRGLSDDGPYILLEADEAYKVSGGGLTKTDLYKNEFKKLISYGDLAKSYCIAFELTNRHIYDYYWKGVVFPVSPGNYYVCDTSSVTYFQKGKLAYRKQVSSKKAIDYFTIGQDLYHFDRPNASVYRVDREGPHPITITGDIAEGSAGSATNLEIIWNTFSKTLLLASGGRIFSVDITGRDTFNTTLLLEGFDTNENKIISSFYDKDSGLLLLGSHTKGLFVFTKKQFSAFRKSEGYSFHEQSLYKNRYILTNFGAYDILSKAEAGPLITNKFQGWGPFATKTGYIWGSKRDTIFLFNEQGTRLLGKWRIGDDVCISYVDLDGNLWLGHRDGLLQRFDMKTLKWTFIRIAGLNVHITFISQDKSPDPRKSTFWMGTGSGLYRFTFPGFRVEKIRNFGNSSVHSLFLRRAEDEMEVWGTISGEGLFLIKNNHATLFPTDRKRHLSSAHCITEDKNGCFWVPTNKGLFQMKANDLLEFAKQPDKNLYYLYYDYESGFPTSEFNGGCIPCTLILPDGQFSMPSISGLVYFNPAKIGPQLPDKPLLIDRIEYNGKRMGKGDTLQLDNDFEFIKFSLSTPYFGHPDNVQIDYQLTSHQQTGSWLPVREGGEIVFNGLGSGRYVLSIRKLNGFGSNNYSTKRLVFIIAPKWYETWWSRTLLLSLLLLATYAFFKRRTRSIEKRNEDLERAVTERTAALKESQNELSRQLNIQAHLIASITHDVRAPLKYVTQASRQIPKLNEMGQYKMLNEVGNALEQSLVQMTNFLDNLLSYVRTTLYHSKVEKSQVDLSELIAQKLILFEKVFLLYGNEVSNDVSSGLTVRSNPELLSVVIHNLIDNASKYARNGQIRIFSSISAHAVHLVIADSGKGIDEEVREWFNNPASAHSDSYGNASPKGFGLVIVKEVARLINLSVFADNHNGCEFHIVFDILKSDDQLQ